MIALGMNPGKEIGSMLDGLLQMVIENPECNTREFLLEEVRHRL